MIFEIILLIIILYIYSIFRHPHETENNAVSPQAEDVSTPTDTTDDSSSVLVTSKTEMEVSLHDASTPAVACTLPIPITTTVQESSKVEVKISETSAKIDVTPAWCESISPPEQNQIRLPPDYNITSKIDRRKIDCLASYRSMTKEKSLDFVKDPFQGDIQDKETLVLVLDQWADQFGIKLNFTKSQHIYDDSDWRTPLDNRHLGNLHSIIAHGNDTTTAKFEFGLDLKYQVVTKSESTLKNFVLKFIYAIAKFINCDPQLIRVFGIKNVTSKNNNISVNFGIITPSKSQTEVLAKQLQDQISTKSILKQETDGILQHIIPNQYPYKLESALVHLQLQESDFELNDEYNIYYHQGHPSECRRGGRPYYLPILWRRHALKVQDKYPQDKVWLGHQNKPGEWSVAYHGTCDFAAKDIVQQGLLHDKVTTDYYREEAKKKVGRKADVKGIYLATHCEGGAAKYAQTFSVKNNDGKEIKYKMVFQCRVEPNKYTEHTGPAVDVGKILRVFDEKAIRPYGILLKQEQEPGNILTKIVTAPSTLCNLS